MVQLEGSLALPYSKNLYKNTTVVVYTYLYSGETETVDSWSVPTSQPNLIRMFTDQQARLKGGWSA